MSAVDVIRFATLIHDKYSFVKRKRRDKNLTENESIKVPLKTPFYDCSSSGKSVKSFSKHVDVWCNVDEIDIGGRHQDVLVTRI